MPYKRVIVKLGTGVLTKGVGNLDTVAMSRICESVSRAMKSGVSVVIVSSGAVGLGMGKLGLSKRPKAVSALQKCAAVGQGILIQTWSELFEPFGITVAQMLVTRDDVDALSRHKSMRDLIEELLESGIVPIINENDCMSAAELNIKFGDNDVLSALIATLSKADALAILSTAPGLVDMGGSGEVITKIDCIDEKIKAMAQGTKSATAVGGMITKIKAAEIATSSGCDVFIASGARENVLDEILRGEIPGTKFSASKCKGSSTSKKRWLAYFGRTIGKIYVDSGAVKALRDRGSSLLPAGIVEISGSFKKGDMVEILDVQSGEVIARGLAHIDAAEMLAEKKREQNSEEKEKVAVHRDNLALV